MKFLIACLAALAVAGCMAHHGGGGGCCPDGGAPPPPPASQNYVYQCPMDGATRATPGPCPKCGMTLGENNRVSQ